MNEEFKVGMMVNFTLPDKHILHFCSITAIKFEENCSRVDLLCQGVKFYDVLTSYITDIAKEVTDSTLLQKM